MLRFSLLLSLLFLCLIASNAHAFKNKTRAHRKLILAQLAHFGATTTTTKKTTTESTTESTTPSTTASTTTTSATTTAIPTITVKAAKKAGAKKTVARPTNLAPTTSTTPTTTTTTTTTTTAKISSSPTMEKDLTGFLKALTPFNAKSCRQCDYACAGNCQTTTEAGICYARCLHDCALRQSDYEIKYCNPLIPVPECRKCIDAYSLELNGPKQTTPLVRQQRQLSVSSDSKNATESRAKKRLSANPKPRKDKSGSIVLTPLEQKFVQCMLGEYNNVSSLTRECRTSFDNLFLEQEIRALFL